MNKTAFIKMMAEELEIPKAQAASTVNVFLELIDVTLQDGNSVQFPGFGTFTVSERSARKGRNPSTGEEIDIAARNVVKFKVGNTLKSNVNR